MKLKSPKGATPIGDISYLIPKHLGTQQELDELEFANINEAMRKYFLKSEEKAFDLSLSWLLDLHQAMFGKVWQWAGKLRQQSLNLGLAPTQIQLALRHLVDNFNFWQQEAKVEVIEISARLHHELVRIHPFINGNGRWARLVTNLYLYSQKLPLLHWPEENLKADSPARKAYIQSLKQADLGDLSELVELHRHYLVP